ncbi:hypothetical protein SLEP1_g42029 [Rubroshorea leprosula]|uniref:Phosphoglycerate mutase-like protein n=1 Tax=Rubroshorea leprosula TaxID=152421 RepID=A0AAV5L8F1_9ROSI|nr:hypothetical protein SLEP1_g42029 [Rubroshorea leprosula]
MDNMTAYFPYPLHHCKILHLVRHGQAMHNVEGDKNRDALLSPHLFDAQLSPLGCEQVDQLRKHFHASGLLNRIDLVITSPLLRGFVLVTGGEGLWTRPEKEIAVVSHGIVLQQMLNVLGNDCNNTIRTTLCKRFDNGELRSVVIVDKTGGMQ